MPVRRLRMTVSPARSEETWSFAATTTEAVVMTRLTPVDSKTPSLRLRVTEQAPGLVTHACRAGGDASPDPPGRGRAWWRKCGRQLELDACRLVEQQAPDATDRMTSPHRARRAKAPGVADTAAAAPPGDEVGRGRRRPG